MATGSGSTAAVQARDNVKVRRLWLPWRPRLRLIFLYPRCWHYVAVRLERFDLWLSRRYTGTAQRFAVAVALLPFIAVRFIGFVVVAEITIIAFAISIYLVWAEWVLLVLLFPFTLLARLVGALPWTLVARAGDERWATRVSGWQASGEAATGALTALSTGPPPWPPSPRPARIWM